MPVSPHLAAHEERWHDAIEKVQHRRMYDTAVKRQMIEASERYANSIVFPLDDVDGEPEFPAIAAQIIADAIDSFALRAGDTLPQVTAPAVNPEIEAHRKRANLRRHAWGAVYHESRLPLRIYRALRQLYGYATFCMYVEPEFHDAQGREVNRPRIVTRDPMLAYPEPMGNDELRAPADIGFVYGRSPQWVKHRFPEAGQLVDDHTSGDDDLWDILDFVDGDWNYIGVLGKRASQSYHRRYNAAGQYSTLGDAPLDQSFLVRAHPNRAGIVPAVCPQAVTLDRLVSAISRIVPTTDLMNKLAALQFIAGEKDVFPHVVVLGENGQTPEIEGGQFRDGRTGEANIISNARAVDTLRIQPSPSTGQLMADLERNARMGSGSPGVFQGEFTGSVRSGQTLNQLASYSIDPRLGEAHRIMGYALEVMNEAVAATEQGYWPRRRYTVYSGWQGSNRHITYVPGKIWAETTESVVAWPMPGMDAQNATIALASLNQARMISRRTAMSKHPLVDGDPEGEERAMVEESLDDAIMMTAVQLVSSGTMAFSDLAEIRRKVRSGMAIEDAIAEAQQEAQERQATQAPVPAVPGMAAPPETMPGLNVPGAGGEMAPPAAPAPQMGQAEQFDQIAAALMRAPAGAA